MQETQTKYSPDYNNYPAFTDDPEMLAMANEHSGFVGSKIPVDKLIGKQIVFVDFVVTPSQYRRFGDSVTKVQIIVDGEKHIFFTQSKNITKTLQVFKDKLPRSGTLIKDDRALKIK